MISRIIENWGIIISYEYDLVGNWIKMIDVEGGEMCYIYDVNNCFVVLCNFVGEVIFFLYDLGGCLIEQCNYNNSYIIYIFNVMDYIIELVNYDVDGNILSSYSYFYDGDGLWISMIDYNGNIMIYFYDGDCCLVGVNYLDGIDENFMFDLVGNCLQCFVGGNLIIYYYDVVNWLEFVGNIFYIFDGNGNFMQKNDGGIIISYEYDGEDCLVWVSLFFGGSLWYSYDFFGNCISCQIIIGE